MSRGTLFLFSCLFGDSPVDLCPRKVRSSVGSDVMFGFCVILFISGVFIGFYSKKFGRKKFQNHKLQQSIMLLAPFTAGLEVADMAWEVKCREEDMKQRSLENERRAIDDARRFVDEKSQQLKAISHLSALIAGFAMITLVEIQIDDDLNEWLLIVFGTTTSVVVGCMLIAMLNSTLMLVAILKYDCVKREVPFSDFWRLRCEDDFLFSLKAFTRGIPIFMLSLGQVGWVVFHNNQGYVIASSSISIVAFVTITLWFVHTSRKWGDFLMSGNVKLFNPRS